MYAHYDYNYLDYEDFLCCLFIECFIKLFLAKVKHNFLLRYDFDFYGGIGIEVDFNESLLRAIVDAVKFCRVNCGKFQGFSIEIVVQFYVECCIVSSLEGLLACNDY